jgi:hypothetical protein
MFTVVSFGRADHPSEADALETVTCFPAPKHGMSGCKLSGQGRKVQKRQFLSRTANKHACDENQGPSQPDLQSSGKHRRLHVPVPDP